MSDPVTTQYTHTLTVTERLGGEYKCHVDSINHKTTSFFDLDAIHIEGMYIDLCDNAYVGLLFTPSIQLHHHHMKFLHSKKVLLQSMSFGTTPTH